MRKKMNILVVIFITVVMTSVFAHAKTTITHLTATAHSESWQEFLHEMAELFEKENPHYEIDIQIGNLDKFLVMSAGGISPDVLDLTTHGAGSAVGDGMFVDLRPFLDRDPEIAARFPAQMLDALTTPNGTLFMLPAEVYSIVTWYNLDLINEAGLAPPAELGDQWDWENMRDYGRKLTERSGDGSTQVWGINRLLSRAYIQTVQAGGNFFDRDIFPRESRLLSDPVMTGVEFIEKLVWEDQVTPPYGVGTSFHTGQAAISVTDGPGIIGTRMRNVGFDWDVTLQPHGPVNNATNVSLNGFEISAGSENPEAAWEWVKFITTTDDAQSRFVKHTGRLPVLREVALSWNQLMPARLPSNWTAFFEQSVHPDNVFLKEGIARDEQVMAILTEHLNKVWSGETSTQVALEEADRLIRPLLDDN